MLYPAACQWQHCLGYCQLVSAVGTGQWCTRGCSSAAGNQRCRNQHFTAADGAVGRRPEAQPCCKEECSVQLRCTCSGQHKRWSVTVQTVVSYECTPQVLPTSACSVQSCPSDCPKNRRCCALLAIITRCCPPKTRKL